MRLSALFYRHFQICSQFAIKLILMLFSIVMYKVYKVSQKS